MAKKKRKRAKYGTARERALLSGLSEALSTMGIETRLERGKFHGGSCRLEGGRPVFFMNKNHSIEHNIALLIAELKRNDFQFDSLDEAIRAELSSAANSSN